MLDSLQAFLSAAENLWIARVLGILAATAAVGLLARWFLHHLEQRLAKTQTLWDDAAVNAARKPLQVLIWVLGLNAAFSVVAHETGAELLHYATRVREVLVIAIMAWFLSRIVREAEYTLTHPAAGQLPVDTTSVRAISRLVRTIIVIVAVLMLLQHLGYSIAGVLAFGGIGGIAVGFAAKDLLANFFGGLMIHLDRPFSIGDMVRSPDRNIEGTVEHIGWRQTRIRTPDKRPLYVPNATFASIAVENPSRMTHRRIQQVVGIRYDDWKALPALVKEIKAMLEAHPDIAQDQTLVVSFEKFSDSALDILIIAHTKTSVFEEFHDVRQDVFFRVLDIVAAANAEIAFPTRTLHIASTAAAPAATEA